MSLKIEYFIILSNFPLLSSVCLFRCDVKGSVPLGDLATPPRFPLSLVCQFLFFDLWFFQFSTGQNKICVKLVFPGVPVPAYIGYFLFVLPCLRRLNGTADPRSAVVKVRVSIRSVVFRVGRCRRSSTTTSFFCRRRRTSVWTLYPSTSALLFAMKAARRCPGPMWMGYKPWVELLASHQSTPFWFCRRGPLNGAQSSVAKSSTRCWLLERSAVKISHQDFFLLCCFCCFLTVISPFLIAYLDVLLFKW